MIQAIHQTDEEKLKMYMENCTKEQLAKMLIECNRILNSRPRLMFLVPTVPNQY